MALLWGEAQMCFLIFAYQNKCKLKESKEKQVNFV